MSEDHAIEAACIAFNSVLLNQPEDERNQPVAMQAAIRAYLAAKEAELAAVKAENERLREALEAILTAVDEDDAVVVSYEVDAALAKGTALLAALSEQH